MMCLYINLIVRDLEFRHSRDPEAYFEGLEVQIVCECKEMWALALFWTTTEGNHTNEVAKE